MDTELLIIKPAESFLKSAKVRGRFERQLRQNIKACLKQNDMHYDYIDSISPRILLYTDETDEAINAVKFVFGISLIHQAVQVGTDLDAMKETALEMLKEAGLKKTKTFAVRAKRVTKDFPLDSAHIAAQIGEFVQEKTKAKVDLKAPDVSVTVEVMTAKSLMFTQTTKGLGGLPLGASGRIACLLTPSKQSVIAAWLMMKRGCEIAAFHLRASDRGQQLAINNLKCLERFAYGQNLRLNWEKSGNVAEQINSFIANTQSKALVVDAVEASELKALAGKINVPVFSPLIGKTEKELKQLETIIFKN